MRFEITYLPFLNGLEGMHHQEFTFQLLTVHFSIFLTFVVMHLDKISWVAYIIFSVILTLDYSARGINGSHFKNAGKDALLLRPDSG